METRFQFLDWRARKVGIEYAVRTRRRASEQAFQVEHRIVPLRSARNERGEYYSYNRPPPHLFQPYPVSEQGTQA